MYRLKFISKILFCFSLLLIFSCKKNIEKSGAVLEYSLDESEKKDIAFKDIKFSSDENNQQKSAVFFNGKSSVITSKLKNMPALDSIFSISWKYKIDSLPKYEEEFDAQTMLNLLNVKKKIGIQIGFRSDAYKTPGINIWQWGGKLLLQTNLPKLKKWHHCVYTFNGKTHTLFLDGVEVANSKVKPQQGKPVSLSLGNSPYGARYFKGYLDEILIYDKVFSFE